jgi:hypothetical protein
MEAGPGSSSNRRIQNQIKQILLQAAGCNMNLLIHDKSIGLPIYLTGDFCHQ